MIENKRKANLQLIFYIQKIDHYYLQKNCLVYNIINKV